MATILSASRSNVLVNGKVVEGLQEISYQTVRNYEDIAAIGTDERVGVVYGLTKVIGTLRIRSANDDLEELLQSKKPFQVFASLKHTTAQGEDAVKEVTLDECYLYGKTFGLATGGVVEVIYQFSATRVR